MADPQQVLYGDDGKPIPSTVLYDDNGKPLSAQPAQGQSHGWLLDNLWNAGERALDIGKGILNASPMGQMQQASDAYNKLQQNPHAFDPQLQSFKQQLGNVTVPQYASALAMNADPTGMVPGEVGLAKQIPSDISQQNYGGALVNTILGALPFLHAFLGPDAKASVQDPYGTVSPGTEMKYARMPDLVDSIPESAKPVTQRGLLNPAPTASPMRQLPAYGETSTQPRFYAGPAGIADARMAYLYDINDISRPSPQTISSGEPGVQAPNDIGPILAANRSIINQVPDKAQLSDAFRALVPDRYAAQPTTQPIGIQGIPKEPDVVQAYREGGKVVNEPNQPLPFNSNQVDVTNRQLSDNHTPEAISARINSIPGIVSGDVVKPSPQQINSAPVDPVLPTDLTIPRPGMATVTRDIGAVPAEFNSFDTNLLNHPTTAPIYQPVVDAESQFLAAESRATQDYAALTKGLNTGQLEDLGRTLNGAETTDAQVQQVADVVKQQVFDPLYNVLPEGTGKFEDYFPHVAAKDDTSYYQQIKNYFLGNKLEPNAENSGAPIFNAGTTASMETPFAKPRTDSLDNIEWNANKTVPLYIHSVLRDAMMSPAVDAAEKSAAGLPDSVMKSLLGSALKNITNFNGEGELKTQWNQLANSTTNTIARAVYDGNLIPHLLHASNLLTQVYPELGEYYTAQAIGRIARNPTEAFNEVTRNGLTSGQQLPWNLKTGMQKFDSISNYGSFIEKLNAAIGYIGSKQRFIDQGMDPATAQLRAMQAARKMNLVTTPATASKVLSSQSNIFGSAGAKIGGLGAKVPTKFAENLVQTMLNARSNPAKFARTIGTMGALATTFGPSVVKHAGTLLNANPLGAIGKTAFQVFSKAAKGDIPGAILTAIESGKYFIPGSIGIPDTIKFLSDQ